MIIVKKKYNKFRTLLVFQAVTWNLKLNDFF